MTFTLKPFFLGAVDLRELFPRFDEDSVLGLFGGTSLAGSIIGGLDFNDDVSPLNGVTGFIDDLTRVGGGSVLGGTAVTF